MTSKAILVLHGFFQLSSTEKQEFIEELNRYQRESDQGARKSIEHKNDVDFNRVVSGPVGVACGCCGR
jgi:hypothetical protein